MIAGIEADIVERLGSKIETSAAKVEAFPDDPKKYKLVHPKGAVLVAYAGAEYAMPGSASVVIQDAMLHWQVSILMRNLRTHGGAYGYLDSVRAALLGWRYPGATGLFMRKEEFVSQDDGIWTYGMTFAHKLPMIQVDDEELEPLLIRLTTNDPAFGNVEVVST